MDIIFSTFNARYSHSALALRCLRANMGRLHDRSEIIEFDISLSSQAAVEKLLNRQPKIILFSVYIWNLTVITETVAILRKINSEIRIVIGGPEVSYEYENLPLFEQADLLICGEGEEIIEEVCHDLLCRRDACDTTPVPQASCLPSFNPLDPVQQTKRKNLPHWTQENATYFVTFRLADSIAKTHLKEYEELRENWRQHHQPPYNDQEKNQFDRLFSERINNWLDEGAGSCILKNPDISKIVADALTHFDNERYVLDEWVVMPNHVHILVTPLTGFDLNSILHTWKSYTAKQINHALDQGGTVWKQESYDHIVRNQEELIRIRKYIRNNPDKTGIQVAHQRCRRDACDTPLSVPQASRLPKSVPQASRLPKSVPQASCLPKSVPQASRLPKSVPQASCLPKSVPQASCLPKSVPQASRLPRVIKAPLIDLNTIALPYDEYTDEDVTHRRIYVETSRGCRSVCQYCLSSLEPDVRFIPPERIFPAFQKLIDRGARVFKFIDRSFNTDSEHAANILRFFLSNRNDGMMLHLEWEPHRLPDGLRKLLKEAPEGFFQLEIGVQTFTPDVAARIGRCLNIETIENNISTLSRFPSVHLHTDLIAGLPGETVQSLSDSFDRLHACEPHEIQLGILKKLRGAPIAQHEKTFHMIYNEMPPYDILQTSTMSFQELQLIRRFARFWDLTVNNSRFPNSALLIWKNRPSVFAAFMEWSIWIFNKTGSTAGFSPGRLARLLTEFLIQQRNMDQKTICHTIETDLNRSSSSKIKGMERQIRNTAGSNSGS